MVKLVKETKMTLDKMAWRCNNKKCRKFFSIRKDSVFQFSNLKIRVYFVLFYILINSQDDITANLLLVAWVQERVYA